MFDRLLQAGCGFTTQDCGSDDGLYIYLDDVSYTGNRIRYDFEDWIKSSAPPTAKVHVIVVAFHRSGRVYAQDRIAYACAIVGKRITLTWWRGLEVEDRDDNVSNSDVLRPSTIPTDQATQDYIRGLVFNGISYPPVPRPGTSIGEHRFFSSDGGRCVLEQEFLKKGLHIRSVSPYLPLNQRPLGYKVLQSLGFGSLIVTYRNCANNCPLALWAGDPWYPLFPRSTNTDAAAGRS